MRMNRNGEECHENLRSKERFHKVCSYDDSSSDWLTLLPKSTAWENLGPARSQPIVFSFSSHSLKVALSLAEI